MQLKFKGIYYDEIGKVRIMAIAEKYVMARRSRCIPFVLTESEFMLRFKENPNAA